MSWSKRMSEIGPIRRKPRFFWRMISWPAANGIICSICSPSATLAPSGTRSVMACCMVRSLDMENPKQIYHGDTETQRRTEKSETNFQKLKTKATEEEQRAQRSQRSQRKPLKFIIRVYLR